MKLIIDSAANVAARAAKRYVELLRSKPNAVLGFATGSTPLELYGELSKLCAEGKLSFAQAASFNLDEYLGLDGSHDQSYRYFMDHNLFMHIDIDHSKTLVPSAFVKSDIEAAEYDRLIEKAGGIDLQLLGIGLNGHIGFNEPFTPFGTKTHIVELTESTREANKRFFADISEVPTHANTMGIKTVMNAKSIILMALGRNKAEIIAKTVNGEVTTAVPASVLQLHPDCELYLDYEAASLL